MAAEVQLCQCQYCGIKGSEADVVSLGPQHGKDCPRHRACALPQNQLVAKPVNTPATKAAPQTTAASARPVAANGGAEAGRDDRESSAAADKPRGQQSGGNGGAGPSAARRRPATATAQNKVPGLPALLFSVVDFSKRLVQPYRP